MIDAVLEHATGSGRLPAPRALSTLQLNVTNLCNQACTHCHVAASPLRRDAMSDETLEACVRVLEDHPSITTVDITGGAPELHPRFRWLVAESRALGRDVIVRHNLTVTVDPHPLTGESLADLPDFFARSGVSVVASLPCYLAPNVDRQRGAGAFAKSIASLRALNARGFGVDGSGLDLTLVMNPAGPALPGCQSVLEAEFRAVLSAEYGVSFTRLFAMTNAPVGRFADALGERADAYVGMLAERRNPATAGALMCRSMVSVGWDGSLYDCDFNQMLGLRVDCTKHDTVASFDEHALRSRRIVEGEHCLACMAGAGSSCCGALEV